MPETRVLAFARFVISCVPKAIQLQGNSRFSEMMRDEK